MLVIISVGFVTVGVMIAERSPKSAPIFSAAIDEAQDMLVVEGASDGADWQRIEVWADRHDVAFRLNAEATRYEGTDLVSKSFTALASTSDVMAAGDYADFCGAGSTVADVTIRLTDARANQFMGTWHLGTVAACT